MSLVNSTETRQDKRLILLESISEGFLEEVEFWL